jgi:hypothetical protein
MKKHIVCSLLCVSVMLLTFANGSVRDTTIVLKWLDTTKLTQPAGVSWGVPFPKGKVKKNQSFSLTTADGKTIPVQSWPLAYWPDGSLKWSGFAAIAGTTTGQLQLNLDKGKTSVPASGSIVKEDNKVVRINTGQLQCVVPKNGSIIIDSLMVDGKMVSGNGKLECILQNGPDGEDFESPAKERFSSKINKVTVEQSGPVRAVVRVQGVMQSEKGQRSWLPFDIRLYFYNGSKNVRLVNTVIYDGDDSKDFIKGLGMVFSVPLQEEMHNRHIRLAGEGPGIWAEPVRPLVGRFPFMLNGKTVFPDQQAGKPVPSITQFEARIQPLIKDLPVWNDYKLVQHTADAFSIQKRTNSKSVWLDANAGKRSKGLVFVGDTKKGGLAIGLKDFWQSYPAALEVRDAAKDKAELRVWLWSPYNDAMDMRHYDTVAHGLDATYEDVQPGFSTPYGIARTSELMLFASSSVPSNEELSNQAQIASQPPLLVTTPEYLHSVNTFGVWSLPDRSTPGKRWVENELDKAVNFYKKEIDQRNWYGFWNYGDVMHAYDPVRHSWKYDIGGFAWDNTELSTDMWLWYSFMRTGRSDIFRMAEAMTRHTSEVDVYHIGRFAGLGSRHNVRHWGCGSKEVRESQTAYRRFYYYLTTDERTGDMMREVAETADKALGNLDPLRLILPKSQYPTHSRIGPDWLALVGNWMTEWERTGDKRWRDKIMAGVNSFGKMPYGFFSGVQGAFGYDPKTQKMYMLSDTAIGSAHLTVLMGGPEVAYELTDLLQNPTWTKLWKQYCELYGAPKEEVQKAFGRNVQLGMSGPWYSRLPAYASKLNNDPKFAQRAWKEFLSEKTKSQFDARKVEGADVLKPLEEVPGISTNNTAQWCLNAIQLLELIGDYIPDESSLWAASGEKK